MNKSLSTFAALSLLSAALGAAQQAQAHVVLDQTSATVGSYYKATFRVGHGCGSSATRQVVVQIPAGAQGAKPMAKPGWALEVTRAPLAQPVPDPGRPVADDVARISWTARTPGDLLPNEQFDEFSLLVKLPATPGTLYWKVSQVCEQGRMDWVEVPLPGQTVKGLKSPAAALEVLPATAPAPAPVPSGMPMMGGEHKH